MNPWKSAWPLTLHAWAGETALGFASHHGLQCISIIVCIPRFVIKPPWYHSLHPIISGLMKWFFSDTMTDRSPVMHAMTDLGTSQSDQPFSGRPKGGQGAGGLPETNTIHCHTQLDLSWIYHGTSHPNIPEIIFLMLNSCIF